MSKEGQVDGISLRSVRPARLKRQWSVSVGGRKVPVAMGWLSSILIGFLSSCEGSWYLTTRMYEAVLQGTPYDIPLLIGDALGWSTMP